MGEDLMLGVWGLGLGFRLLGFLGIIIWGLHGLLTNVRGDLKEVRRDPRGTVYAGNIMQF